VISGRCMATLVGLNARCKVDLGVYRLFHELLPQTLDWIHV
jgi:hypothetical protein